MESDFLKSDIGGSLEWGLWEDLFDSEAIYHHIMLASYANPRTYTSDTGDTVIYEDGWGVRTGTTSGSVAEMNAMRGGNPGVKPQYTWDRRRMFKVVVNLQNDVNQEGLIAIGGEPVAGLAEEHVGFYILNDEIHISVADGATHNHSLVRSFTAGANFLFKAKLWPGNRAEFWIDGTKEGELTSNLPSGTSRAERPLTIYVTNTAAADKRIEPVDELWFLQLED